MRYILKQKMLSFVDRFTVQDMAGRDVYWVNGEIAFSPTCTFATQPAMSWPRSNAT